MKSKASPPPPMHQLIESALEFLTRAADDMATHPKYSIINFATGVELLLKARLMKEHWSLIVEKPGDAVRSDFTKGLSRPVVPREAMKRLGNLCNAPVPKDTQIAFEAVAAHRNRVMHFFHEAMAENAAPALREAVTIELCRCWYYLERLLNVWGEPFTDYQQKIWGIDNQMKNNRTYLNTVYDSVASEILTATQAGSKFVACSGCGYRAAEVHGLTGGIDEQVCRVCKLAEQYVQIRCPNPACSSEVRMLADHGSERACPECQHRVTTDEIREALSTQPFEFEPSGPALNCAYCIGNDTVICHNNNVYVCTECLRSQNGIDYCGWCSDGQIGGDLEDSSITGCEFCEGRLGWDKD